MRNFSRIPKSLISLCAATASIILAAGCGSHGGSNGLPPTPTSAKSSPRTAAVMKAAVAAGESAFPSGTPWAVPGQIAFDNFDQGGQGVAYHTTLTNNPGGQYRPSEQVGIEHSADVGNGNGYDVGWNNGGFSYNYTVNVGAAATYPVALRVATNSASSVHIEDELGNNLTGAVQIPASGGFQNGRRRRAV